MAENDIPIWDPDAIDWNDVEELRRMDPMDKILASLRLYDLARGFSLMGIRRQHPSASEEEVERLFDERMRIGRPW